MITWLPSSAFLMTRPNKASCSNPHYSMKGRFMIQDGWIVQEERGREKHVFVSDHDFTS